VGEVKSVAGAARGRLGRLLRVAVAPMLRAGGFVRSGQTWRRRRGDAIELLAVSSRNLGHVSRFSLVAALWYPAVARRLRQPANPRPKWWEGHVRWYELGAAHTIAPDTDDAVLQRRVEAQLRRLLRWLAPRCDVRRAYRALPRAPNFPPSIAVQDALRKIAGRKPVPRPKNSPPSRRRVCSFKVLSIRPG
jgi:hypothetical protein